MKNDLLPALNVGSSPCDRDELISYPLILGHKYVDILGPRSQDVYIKLSFHHNIFGESLHTANDR